MTDLETIKLELKKKQISKATELRMRRRDYLIKWLKLFINILSWEKQVLAKLPIADFKKIDTVLETWQKPENREPKLLTNYEKPAPDLGVSK